MKLSCNPENTLAILVGIEQYRGTKWPDLIGPALDVLRLAKWLLEQGVRPDRIKLYLNFGKINADLDMKRKKLYEEILSLGVSVAIEPNIINLSGEFRSVLQQGENGLLICYFSGHGVSSGIEMSRNLLTSDVKPDELSIIDITNLAKKLRLHEQCRFKQQWIIQDACAQNIGSKGLSFKFQFGLTERDDVAQQDCLFSSSPGKSSYTNSVMGYSDFTNMLLNALNNRHLKNLDIDAVYLELEAAYKKAYIDKENMPVLSRFGCDWSESCHRSGTKTPATAKNKLVKVLNSLQINLLQIQCVYRLITQAEKPPPCDFFELIDSLEDYPPFKPGLTNTCLFVIHLSHFCHKLSLQKDSGKSDKERFLDAYKKLETWIAAGPRKNAGPAVTAEKERLDAEKKAASDCATFVLLPFAEDYSKVWYFDNDEWSPLFLTEKKVNLDDSLDDWLVKTILEISQTQGIGDQPVVELVLPLKKLFEPYCGLKINLGNNIEFCLGKSELILILRLEERLNLRHWRIPWLKQWNQIQSKMGVTPRIRWDLHNLDKDKDGWQWVAALKHQTESIPKALQKGAPFALWCAEEDASFIENEFAKHTYMDFHYQFQKMGNFSPNQEAIYCLVDDPDRVPPGASPFDNQLRQPGQRT